MFLRLYLGFLTLITIICFFIITGIIFKIDPNTASSDTLIAFFVILFLIIFSITTFIGYFLRLKILKKEFYRTFLIISSRQAALISLAIIGLLLLSVSQVLNWWDGVLLVAAVLLLELYFRAK